MSRVVWGAALSCGLVVVAFASGRQSREREVTGAGVFSGNIVKQGSRQHAFRAHFLPTEVQVVPDDAGTPWGLTLGAARLGRTEAPPMASQAAQAEIVGEQVHYDRGDVVEWYWNKEAGLEHGFSLAERPAGAGDLVVWVRFAGLAPLLGGGGSYVGLHGTDGTEILRYRDLFAWDATGAPQAAHFVVADGGDVGIVVQDETAIYPLVIDPLLTAPGWVVELNTGFSRFGNAVSGAGDVNGDGFADVIVGAYEYDNGQSDEGRAYVYHGTATGLRVAAAWTAESNLASARFGWAVAAAGDVNGDGFADVIVGADRFDNGQSGDGRAYAFYGSTTGLLASPAWLADPAQSSSFAYAVAGAGDVNGDGFADVVVGHYNYANGQSDEGRAYVYHGSATGLALVPSWTFENNLTSSHFGAAVAGAGDVNGDGYSDLLVGSPQAANGQSGEGRAYVFHGSATGLTATASWTAESNQASAAFGTAVGAAGDVNGDGFADVIVGTPFYDNGQSTEGRAYVFHGSAAGLVAAAAWTGEGNSADAIFGWAVGSAGDVNGDGFADVIAGAVDYTNGETNEGRADVYHGTATGLAAAAGWSVESNRATAQLGSSVASAGDVNGDGFADVIVGAPDYGNGQTQEGRVSVFHGRAASLLTSTASAPTWAREADLAGAHLGTSVSGAGDVDGDGFADVIVGAPAYSNGETNEGITFAFHGTATGLPAVPSWTAELDETSAAFGSVAVAGDVNGDGFADVIAGAPGHANGEPAEGGAYAFHGSATGLAAAPSWATEGSQPQADLGGSVSGAGDVNGDGFADVIVGAAGYANGELAEGSALVFHGSAAGLATTPGWVTESNQADAALGMAVSGAGDVNGDAYSDVLVAAPQASNGHVGEGRVLSFHGSATGLGSAPGWSAEANQVSAALGLAVSHAGDIDGDAFADVLLGAPFYDNGEADEGRAYLFRGSATGLAATPSWTFESNQAGAHFGTSVLGAGDVNSDGFADVVVGSSYSNGQAEEGRVYLFHGGPAGLSATVGWMAESDQAAARFGNAVAGAGDIDGDGYADIIVGAPQYSNGQAEEGKVYVFRGNDGEALPGVVAAQRTHGSTRVLGPGQRIGSQLTLQLRGRSTLGRGQAKLQWELKPSNQPFDGTGLAATEAFQSTTTGVATYSAPVTVAEGAYHWRVRLLHDPTRSPITVAERWFYPAWPPAMGPDFRAAGASAPELAGASVLGSVAEGSASAAFDVQVSATDVDSATTTYRVDCDGDGTYGEAGEPEESQAPGTYVLACSEVSAAAWNGPGSRSIGIQLFDGILTLNDTSHTVTVTNVPPSILSIDHATLVDEGTSVTVTVVATDVDPTLTYDFDCDGDSLYDGANDVTGQASSEHSCPVGDDGTLTLGVRVHDGVESAADTSSVTVANLAPTVAPSLGAGPYSVLDVLTCVSNYADIPADPPASVTYDWVVDGAALGLDQSTLTSTHFVGGDTVTCTVTATDGDGGTAPVTSSGAQLIDPDCDDDGLADTWEQAHFSGDARTCDLPSAAGDDADADGRTNAQEELAGTNPAVSDAPPAPSILAPVDGAVVGSQHPTLTVTNAVDVAPDDTFTYAFAIYGDAALSVLVLDTSNAPEGSGSTSWDVSAVTLAEDSTYWWRARAHDGYTSGAWSSVASFSVSSSNDAPVLASVTVLAAVDEGTVAAAFDVAIEATDAEGDTLTFRVDCDGDGSYDEPGEPQEVTPPGAVQLSCTGVDMRLDNGPGSRAIYAQVSDGATTQTEAASVQVLNVPPTLVVTQDGAVSEGDISVVLSSAALDPVDVLTFDYDCDNDGTFELADAGASATCVLIGVDDGTLTLTARVSDATTSAQASTVLTVLNSPPSLAPSLGAGPFTTLSVLTCDLGYSDIALDTPPASTTYAWLVNGIGLAHSQPTLAAPHFSGGDSVQCVAHVADGDGGEAGPTASPTITIGNDCDGDGLDDSWEELHLGGDASVCDLPSGPSDDPDGDGRTNLEEQAAGTSPTQSSIPSAPTPLAPIAGAEVAVAMPELVVANVLADPPTATITYDFEVYSDASLTLLVDALAAVPAGTTTTRWPVSVALADGAEVWWRARASNGAATGPWSTPERFLVTLMVPGAPEITSTPGLVFGVGIAYRYDPVASGVAPFTWSLEEAPAGMSIDAATGSILWSPTVLGPVEVRLRATNSLGSGAQAFTLARAAGPPRIVQGANTDAAVGAPYAYDVDRAVDLTGVAPGESFLLEIVSAPATLQLDTATGVIGWQPHLPGDHGIVLALRLPDGTAVDTYAFSVSVLDVSQSDIVALADVSPGAGLAPLVAGLDGSQSRGTDGRPIVSYTWDLADGSVTTLGSAVHQHSYARPGGYQVSLRVRDKLGFAADDSAQVLVSSPGNTPPRARIVASTHTGPAPLTVSFSCACHDDDGRIVSILWEFGDTNTSPASETQYVFAEADTSYRVRLSVEDDGGLLSYDSLAITTQAAILTPPLVRIIVSEVDGVAPLAVALVADVFDADGVPVAFTWTLPDGSTRDSRVIHEVLPEPGHFSFALAVQDNDGLTGYDTRTIVVRNAQGRRPPRILSLPATTGTVGAPYRYDDDGLPSAQGDREIFWSLGKLVGDEMTNVPASMSLEPGTGRIIWLPGHDQVGEHRVTLVAHNNVGADIQEFVIAVQPADTTPSSVARGCACGQQSADAAAPGLLVLLAIRPLMRLRRCDARRA